MNLAELKKRVDLTIQQIERNGNSIESIPVYVTTSDDSLGGRAKIGVIWAGMGFDWEHGEFRIDTSEKIKRIVY